jgi:delta 1-pyrroline-5-carboxylate dehydrogenase
MGAQQTARTEPGPHTQETIEMTLQLKDMTLLKRQGWIDGQWVDADSGKVFAVTNPATGQTLVEVADMGAAETRRAIDAAARALPGWRGKTAKERAQVLRRWFDLIIAHTEDLAQLMTAEQASLWLRPAVRWPMARVSWSGLPKRPSAPMAT